MDMPNRLKFGIGIDIESIARFEGKDIGDRQLFLDKIFTKDELDYCFSRGDPTPHLAARFCSKEAIVKAMYSVGISGIPYSDIEIRVSDSGAPVATILNKEFNNLEIKLSMSHCEETCVACALVIRDAYGDDKEIESRY